MLSVLARVPGVVEYDDSFVRTILEVLPRALREAISQCERTTDNFEKARLIRAIGTNLDGLGII